MLTVVYNILIHLFYVLVLLATPFDQKARQWITGRKNWRKKLRSWQHPGSPTIWFHAASLGEFEQGRPLMEEIKRQVPGSSLVVTFYSPSGFEIRKNYPEASLVCYLPLDTPYNARTFMDLVKPDLAFFIKYEFWYFYLKYLHQASIPVYLVSGIFRPNQIFFRWFGHWSRRKLSFFTHFFLQDRNSSALLNSVRLNNTTVAGDTRFDRVSAIAATSRTIDIARAFSRDSLCIVAGSTWSADEDLLSRYINASDAQVKLIIAPHEINRAHIDRLTRMIGKSHILFSEASENNVGGKQVLVIDNIGMLSSIYRYGRIAYVGGGFGKGIHNILEAAVYGIPVVFGPNNGKFREARELTGTGAAFAVDSFLALKDVFDRLIGDPEALRNASMHAKKYIGDNTGATGRIVQHVLKSQPSLHGLNKKFEPENDSPREL